MSMLLCWPAAYASADEEEGGSGPTGPAPSAYIDDLSVVDDTSNEYGYFSNPSSVRPISIAQKGGSVNLKAIAWWNDGNYEVSPPQVTFEIIGASGVVSLTGTTLTALGDGDVTLRARVNSDTADGVPFYLDIPVSVTGQAQRFINSIVLLDENDNVVDAAPLEEALEKAIVQFHAQVGVVDPSTGELEFYDTRNGRLSVQAPDLSDIVWAVTDSQLASVSEDGAYRPRVYGTCGVFAYSYAGVGGTLVTSNTVTIDARDPNGYSEAHTQTQIEVTVRYEAAPDYVATKTYTVSDMEALPTFNCMYTLTGMSGQGAFAAGYGVSLRDFVIDAAELNPEQGVDAVSTITFYGCDGANAELTKGFLFDTPRYHFPNYDLNGSTAGAVSVEPMLAFTSNWRTLSTGATWDDMVNNTQFRLLFGSTASGQSVTSYSIKWINAITITLSGGPQTGDPDEPPADDESPAQIEGSEKVGGGSGGVGEGTGSGEGSSGEGPGEPGIAGGIKIGNVEALGDGDSHGVGDSEGVGNGKEWSIYQVMNPYESDIDIDYPDNPLLPYAAPLALLCFVAGGTQAWWWFRRQARPCAPMGS